MRTEVFGSNPANNNYTEKWKKNRSKNNKSTVQYYIRELCHFIIGCSSESKSLVIFQTINLGRLVHVLLLYTMSICHVPANRDCSKWINIEFPYMGLSIKSYTLSTNM